MNKRQFLTRELVKQPSPDGCTPSQNWVYGAFLFAGALLRVVTDPRSPQLKGKTFTERVGRADRVEASQNLERRNRFYRGQWGYNEHGSDRRFRLQLVSGVRLNSGVNKRLLYSDFVSVKAVIPVCPYKQGG